MPGPLWAEGGGMPELWGLRGGCAGNLGDLGGGYAGAFVGSWGGMPEFLWA